jgi:hypothetical protein
MQTMFLIIKSRKYDDKGNVIEETGHRRKGGLNYSSKITYDEKNNLIEKSDFNPEGKLKWKFTYKYAKEDSNGNWLEQVVLRDGKPISVIERVITYH